MKPRKHESLTQIPSKQQELPKWLCKVETEMKENKAGSRGKNKNPETETWIRAQKGSDKHIYWGDKYIYVGDENLYIEEEKESWKQSEVEVAVVVYSQLCFKDFESKEEWGVLNTRFCLKKKMLYFYVMVLSVSAYLVFFVFCFFLSLSFFFFFIYRYKFQTTRACQCTSITQILFGVFYLLFFFSNSPWSWFWLYIWSCIDDASKFCFLTKFRLFFFVGTKL